jgi:hypothetical protein
LDGPSVTVKIELALSKDPLVTFTVSPGWQAAGSGQSTARALITRVNVIRTSIRSLFIVIPQSKVTADRRAEAS